MEGTPAGQFHDSQTRGDSCQHCEEKHYPADNAGPPPKQQKAFITLGSPVVPLLSTSKADSGLASEFRWDRAGYTTCERMRRSCSRVEYLHTSTRTNNQNARSSHWEEPKMRL